MKRKFLLVRTWILWTGLILAISLIWAGANAATNIVTNGNFEGGFTADGTGDRIPNGWTKLETFSGGPGETSNIYDVNDNGPTLAGSWSLGWGRFNGGTSGDWTACEQTLNYDVSGCASLDLTIDVKALYHNLGGSGWTELEFEYPVTIVVYYFDTQGTYRYWQWGWYYWIDEATGPRPDHKQVPNNGVVTGQQVPQATWVANNFNLLTELINPKTIVKIRVGGAGWDFEGQADNVQILCTKGWYWKPAYEDYAPSGMPDFDQKQDNWIKPVPGNWSFCGPTAVANCFWWFDSKYNVPAGVPGDAIDRFPLVRDYLDALAARVGRDDHDPWNVNHANTPWFPGLAPPATSQPFVPGAQTPGGGLTAWGELVERLAWYMDTDGRRTGYLITGTKVDSMQAGIQRWLLSETFEDGTTLADILYEITIQKPTFAQVESLVEKCEDVILLLGFWYYGPGEQEFIRGDINENGVVDMADYSRCLSGPPYSCDDAADVNDDGFLNTLDCDYLLNWLNHVGPPPPPPYPDCGLDPTADALGCAHFPPCTSGPYQWYRVGGHYVTVAGVCSDSLKIAFSDPFVDWAEQGHPGIIDSGTIIPHSPIPHTDSTIHNDAGNVSHDIYDVTLTSPSPGGLWGISNYPASDTVWMRNFNGQSIPGEFVSKTRPWDGVNTVYAEVEYAVVISPIPRNLPPKIIQPDTLHGYTVGDAVSYTFDGIDPDGDVINDTASLSIVPSCGSYSVSRISGQGTSNGTWQVNWLTTGCQSSITYKIIVDLKDALNNTSYCTTYVYLAKRECSDNDPSKCDTLWAKCGNMRVPIGGGLVKVEMNEANDETLGAIVVPLSYKGSPLSCDSMPPSENTVAKVFAGSRVANMGSKLVNIDHANKKVLVVAIAMSVQQYLPPGKGLFGTLTFLGDSCCTMLLDTTTYTATPAPQNVNFVRTDAINFYPVCRIDTCHIDRDHPPVIDQPDSLEGYVDSTVTYAISGTDPEGDVIQDSASIKIVPSCGSYSITRTTGHGTSSGIWTINWNTQGCTAGTTYLVIHDLTDVLGATAYCTTKVYLSRYEPWPNHKMHFPQLPDLIGWDVNATWPKILADDWQCSQYGWVTDIHFWGSWKDTDGDPSTDNYYTPAPTFMLSIHENIPATPDTPWSRPGKQVWGWTGEIPGIPSEPPSLEGWYDPNTDSSICNDHVPYWRYDFAHLPDSFFQYKDRIYWLNISALNIPEPYQWGWKNSRDHFMDDAVYRDTPTGRWRPIVEPPRCNKFNVLFNSAGYPQDMGSTNYYGNGWYQYEYWTNMWFYDNPFTTQRPKHIVLNFDILPAGPAPNAQFAINWSTPEWDMLGMGRPPLPGENEMLYIGRQIFQVAPGPNTIYDTIPYNPEWVSVDFVATDVIINGTIWHECVGTSLDLAFVITGHEGVPPVKCGDVNNDGILGLGDVVYLITYQYKGGPPPVPCKCVGDVNNDDVVGLGDVVYLISYQYKGGPAPNPNCCNPPWGYK